MDNTKKVCLKDLSYAQLQELLGELGEPRFRAKQVYKWLYQKGAATFDEMTDLPLQLRKKLEEIGFPGSVFILKKQVSQRDGTCKYLFGLGDGNAVEGVLMSYKYGLTACISSQVGCKMGCRLCASGLEGWVRDLRSSEMYDQVLAMQQDTGKKIGNLVLMGAGEPLDNYDEVIAFINTITSPHGLNMSGRSITLSTCGIVPKIYKLAGEGLAVNLAVSLHAPDNELRNNLIPVNKKYPLEELMPSCKEYAEKTGRRVTFEYALIDNLNDGAKQAEKLAGQLKDIISLVNLIPANHVPELGIAPPPQGRVERFKNILEDRGINVTVRRKLGADIDAACGQLRRRALNK